MAIPVKIDEDLKIRVRQLADSRRRSSHWIMREAILQYVEREEARASFRAEAMNAWKAYSESGMHLTGAEVRGWLGKWGTESETEAPGCHD